MQLRFQCIRVSQNVLFEIISQIIYMLSDPSLRKVFLVLRFQTVPSQYMQGGYTHPLIAQHLCICKAQVVKDLQHCALKGFHEQDPVVAVGFLSGLAVFWTS